MNGEPAWFYAQDRQRHGPVAWHDLQTLAASGQLRVTDMLLRAGERQWHPAATVAGLFPGAPSAPEETIDAPSEPHRQSAATLSPTPALDPQGALSFAVRTEGTEEPATGRLETAQPVAVPGYAILGELGRGGMGVVYKAFQVGLNRTVALKMILAGSHADAKELTRFRSEAESVARLQHPHIVQIYEIGEHQGLPFFSLEFCPGGSLAQQLNGAPQPGRKAAALVEVLARAMEAAHQQGIVHRDLKPANILLASGGREPESTFSGGSRPPLADLMPKITDFGLAKQLDNESGQTRSGTVLGTPSYMAPEQAAGQLRAISPRTDVYALGAILYELLTGRPPFRGESPMDTMMQVLSDEPVPPSRLQSKVPRDLETICLKCLQKDPGKRYASAQGLADDLRRFLDDQPIQARPVGRGERLWRWCRRNPGVAALTAAVALALLAGTGISSHFAVQAHFREQDALRERDRADKQATAAAEERDRADQQRARADQKAAEAEASARRATEERLRADRRSYLADMRLAQRAWEDNQVGTLTELLDSQRPERTGGVELRGFEWHYWHRLSQAGVFTFKEHTGRVQGVAFSPDGRRVASASADGSLKVWDAVTGKVMLTLPGHSGGTLAVAFSPDGKRLASGGADGTVKLWEATNRKELQTLKGHEKAVLCVAFSPDGQRLASGSDDHKVKVWDLATAKATRTFTAQHAPIHNIAFSPDGELVASASGLGAVGRNPQRCCVQVWSPADGKVKYNFPGHKQMVVHGVAFSPDGKLLAAAGSDLVKTYDLETGMETRSLPGHTGFIASVVFSADGKQLATAGWDQTVRVWDTATGLEAHVLKGHTGRVWSVAFRPDGQRLASASEDQTVKVWDLSRRPEAQTFRPGGRDVLGLAVSPDGSRLAFAGYGLRVWDVALGRVSQVLANQLPLFDCVAFSPDGRRLAAGTRERTVTVWDLDGGKLLHEFKGHNNWVVGVAWSPDGRQLASASKDQTVKVWDVAEGREVHNLAGHLGPVMGVAFHPAGRLLATASQDQTIKLWDATTGREQHLLRGHTGTVHAVAFSPDGNWLASGSEDCTTKLWDLARMQETLSLHGHASMVYSLGFHPDGRRLASAGQDGAVTVWDLSSGKATLTLPAHKKCAHGVVFTPDGSRLLSASCDETVKVWDATPVK